MSRRPLRMLKFGGSLLDLPDAGARLRAWLALQPPAPCVLVAGGGPPVDALRALDLLHRLDAATVHFLAIDALGWSARVMAAVLPEFTRLADWAAVCRAVDCASAGERRASCAPRIIFDPVEWLRTPAISAKLPADWTVTSDAIAALAANMLAADELVLLKSALPAPARDWTALAASGYVDHHFPALAAALRVRAVNLRATPAEEWVPPDSWCEQASGVTLGRPPSPALRALATAAARGASS